MDQQDTQPEAAGRLWPPTWPMGLTMLRLLLLPVFLWALLADSRRPDHDLRWLAVAIFAIMALTDKLDGYLARRLNQTSKLGAFLDPMADKILVACSVILLSFEWIAPEGFRIPLWLVGVIYGKDLLLVLGTIALMSTIGQVTIKARAIGKSGTVLQLTLVIAVLIAPGPDATWFGFWWYLVRGLWVAVTLVAVASTIDYVIQGWRQFAVARQPAEPDDRAVRAESKL